MRFSFALLGAILAFHAYAAEPETKVSTTPLEGDPACIATYGACEVDTLLPGALLYTNRTYTVADCPDHLRGKPFLRSSIDWVDFRCTQGGVLTILTPDPGHPQAASIYRKLEQRGFTRITTPEVFQLFGQQPFDRVRTYQKVLTPGERYRLPKWGVVAGFAQAVPAGDSRIDWSANQGETLYNGIRLPEEWPPQYVDPRDTEPMAVPYLDAPPAVIPIDIGRQLFVDDFLIQSTNLVRRFHLPEKYAGNPVLQPETELEWNRPNNAAAVPKSGGLWWDPATQQFVLWYEAGWIHTICRATSRDGLLWERPGYDIQPGTNQVLPDDITCDSWTVVPDPWTADAGQRYKLFVRPPGGQMPGISLVSPDGIHWTQRVATGPTGDRSTMFYNPFRKKWVYSLRSSFRGRSRDYWEADDFLAGAVWDDQEPVLWAAADRLDLPDPEIGDPPQLYNLDAVAYESLMLGFFEIHLGPPNERCMEQGLPKITELNFAYSRDGFHWHRPDRTPAIRAERRDVWDRGYVQSLGNLCVVRGDRLWFYYSAFRGDASKTGPHWLQNGMYDRGAMGVAILRRDGFASMDAGSEEATLVTRPVRFSGKHLFVNVDAQQGALRAELLDEAGRPIEPFTLAHCRPIQADSTLEPVSWTGGDDLSALGGRPIRLRFSLANGSLYAFWVSADATGRSDGYVAGGGPGFTGPTDTVGRAALEVEKPLGLSEDRDP